MQACKRRSSVLRAYYNFVLRQDFAVTFKFYQLASMIADF